MVDAKDMWEAIKSRFSEGLHKGYDRFQTLLSQLETHGAGVLHEDANQKFLRSNLLHGTTALSSNTQNVAFMSAENTSSTNDVSTAYSVSSPSVLKSQKEGSLSYTDEINDDDMEEMDLKWQVAMISMRIKKFHKRTKRKLRFDTKDSVGFDKTKVECFNCYKIGYFARDYRTKGNQDSKRRDAGYNKNKTKDNGRRPAYHDDSKSLVTIDGEDIDALKDKGIIDSGCSKHMTGNKAHLADYQEFKGGSIAFEGSHGRMTGKRKIKTGRLDFEDAYYVKKLKHYNLFSVSQMCDKKNKVLFTDTDCLVLSPDFKLPDKNQVLLKIPRQHNMYSFNIKNIDPSGDLACLFAKASIDESNKWHRRLGHVKFKNLNKLLKGNLVRGLPSKIFENDHTCVAYQ
nr:ribonuclease H-like domain-containing protein [Tanacetum cinerariifolium]